MNNICRATAVFGVSLALFTAACMASDPEASPPASTDSSIGDDASTNGVQLDVSPTSTESSSRSNWYGIVANVDAPMEQRIDAAIQGIEQDTCFRDREVEDALNKCDWDTFDLHSDYVDDSYKDEEAILIIDNFWWNPGFLRYRHRILGYYKVVRGGFEEVEEERREWKLPTTLGKILTGFASYSVGSAAELEPLYPSITTTYSDDVRLSPGHGDVIGTVLLDRVPNHPVVFLTDYYNLHVNKQNPNLFCETHLKEDGSVDVAELRNIAEDLAGDLSDLINDHNIHFINMSWGFTSETIREQWRNTCDTQVPSGTVINAILGAYQPIFDVLFDTPGVFTAHASATYSNPEDAPFDVAREDFPNRLRIGVFDYLGTNIPAYGTASVPEGSRPYPTDESNADIYINAGCSFYDCRETGFLGGPLVYGIGDDIPIMQPFTSYVTPIALARVVQLRGTVQFRHRSMSDVLIEDIISEVSPLRCGQYRNQLCRYLDPLWHDQFEAPIP